MSEDGKHTISLSEELDAFIKEKVASGTYASEQAVISEAIALLRDQEKSIEQWLLEDVVPAYDALEADPSRGIPLNEAFDQIRAKRRMS